MTTDPYLWLEDVEGESALDWVQERNADTVGRYAQGERFERAQAELREVLDAEDRIPYVRRHGEYFYNFWQDAEHPRGLWRRTRPEQYRAQHPRWQTLIDVDALATAEDENWVWGGVTLLRPDFDRGLVKLSRGGADATVVREFDLNGGEFVAGGFELKEARNHVGWIDADRIHVGTDFGPDSLTTSGYPRITKEWRRDTPLSAARTIFEGDPDNILIFGYHDSTPGYERDFVYRSLDFYHAEEFLRLPDGELRLIDIPQDAEMSVHREWMLINTRSAWEVNGTEYPAGALLATRFDDYLSGARDITVLFTPDAHTALDSWQWTKNHLILGTLTDVRTELHVLTPAEPEWRREPMRATAQFDAAAITDTDPHSDDEFLLNSSGFLQPATLSIGQVGGEPEILKSAPERFDSSGMTVEQHFATSLDGTAIPYFLVRPKEPLGPTLLTGYGGFEISLTPSYSGIIGRGWLAKGGSYVVANIRGGGEYGPEWHSKAVKENRHLVYEDFASVAADIVERGICTREQLGIQGGSNGGLLMGMMLTRYPRLFGAISCQVPLLDMARYHRLLAGASWIAEYGDPDDEAEWEYLREYSPYQLAEPGKDYPPTLFLTSTRDDRVHPGHARKMAARLHEFGYAEVNLYENIEGGHGSAANNAQLAFKWALIFEFLWSVTNG